MKNTCLNLLATLVLASTGAARATAQDCQYAVGYGLQIFKSVDGSWVQVGNGMTVPPGVPVRFRGWVSVGANGCDACCAEISFDYITGSNCGGAIHEWQSVGTMKPISAGETWEWISPTLLPNSYIVIGYFLIDGVQSSGYTMSYGPSTVFYVPCTGDVTGDLVVNVNDLLAVINNWGTQHNGPCGDDNHDGVVNLEDLITVISSWGSCY